MMETIVLATFMLAMFTLAAAAWSLKAFAAGYTPRTHRATAAASNPMAPRQASRQAPLQARSPLPAATTNLNLFHL